MFVAVLFLMLAALGGIGWIGWQMMPLCPSEDGFEGHDLRETQGAEQSALCVGSAIE